MAADDTPKLQVGSLKEVNLPMLRGMVIVNAVFCLMMILGVEVGFESLGDKFNDVLKSALLIAVASLATYLISEVIPDNIKAAIVFLRFRNPLPGCRAFSVYAVRDPRVGAKGLAQLSKKHGELPSRPMDQNYLWYRILKSWEGKAPHILENHRVFLLARDAASIAAVLTVLVAASILAVDTVAVRPWWLVGLLLGEFLIANLAARSLGISLVKNVLAEEARAP